MVEVRFINDTTPIEVEAQQQETSIGVQSQSTVTNVGVNSTARHDVLLNRDLPDQHPIEAITGLHDILNKLWTFTYEQGVASDTWTITHNLGRNPSVIIVDSAGSVQIPDQITYDNENKITIQFIGAFAGKAFLN